jgi:hypothetical protein
VPEHVLNAGDQRRAVDLHPVRQKEDAAQVHARQRRGKTHAGVEGAFAGPDIVLGRCDFGATGFYSYGEIAPMESSTLCDLHNQTMTITTLAEA